MQHLKKIFSRLLTRQESLPASAHDQIEDALFQYIRGHTWPTRIIVPEYLYISFAADVASTGYAETVWSVPVVDGEVSEINVDGGQPYSAWQRFWRWFPGL